MSKPYREFWLEPRTHLAEYQFQQAHYDLTRFDPRLGQPIKVVEASALTALEAENAFQSDQLHKQYLKITEPQTENLLTKKPTQENFIDEVTPFPMIAIEDLTTVFDEINFDKEQSDEVPF